MKDWADQIFGAFLGVLASISVVMYSKHKNRKKEELEFHNKYLDTMNKLEAFKREKLAEMEKEAEDLKEIMRENALRYKENLDQLLLQLKERSGIILQNQQTIAQLKRELNQLREQVNGNH
jgi:hypothetical protein